MINLKKSIILGIFIVLLLVLSSREVKAFGLGQPFGGMIINTKATTVELLEDSDFKCIVPGQTITIKPVGKSPINYFIPASTISWTKTTPRSDQWILGLYSTPTVITCIFQGYPPEETTVNLNTITLWGTSK